MCCRCPVRPPSLSGRLRSFVVLGFGSLSETSFTPITINLLSSGCCGSPRNKDKRGSKDVALGLDLHEVAEVISKKSVLF